MLYIHSLSVNVEPEGVDTESENPSKSESFTEYISLTLEVSCERRHVWVFGVRLSVEVNQIQLAALRACYYVEGSLKVRHTCVLSKSFDTLLSFITDSLHCYFLDTPVPFDTDPPQYLRSVRGAHSYRTTTFIQPFEKVATKDTTMDAPLTPFTLIPGTPELPAEVILSILEELHEIQDISTMRIVSKQFDALIVPISYRRVHLTKRILAPFACEQELDDDASNVQLQVARDVKNHARHLTIKRNLDWSLVAKLIKLLRNLLSFTWAYWPFEASLHESPNSTIGPALCKRWPNVQLHFEKVRASSHRPSDFVNFPNSNLVSCRIARWEERDFPMIRELLFDRPRLQELHLRHGGHANIVSLRPKIEVHGDQNTKRLPALKTLILDGYNWNYSQWEISTLWNWSSITHLELIEIQVIELLQQVSLQDLSSLKIFIEKCTSNYEESNHKRKSKLLCRLVRHTTALEELKIHCEPQKCEIVSALARTCSHLRTLSLRCFMPYREPSWTAPTLDKLDTLGSNCPQLMEIGVHVALPTFSHAVNTNSRPTTKLVGTSASTILTRSTSRIQHAKREANNKDRDNVDNPKLGEERAKQKIPHWYMEAYDDERYLEDRHFPSCRAHGLDSLVIERRISYSQACNEYLAWKLSHRKEEVATMREQARTNSAPALARFRNLRRLKVFARLHHFTAQETDDRTSARTRKAVQSWLNELLSMKQGAEFEEVVVYASVDVMNEKAYTRPEWSELTFTYTGKMDFKGNAQMREEPGHFMKY